jgi:tRNA nucleotidyltransferase (CCA-adding enzyme)
VPGVDIAGLREALAPHGRTEELVVADRPVGVRFFPSDKTIRRQARAGIEVAPPRREISTGPGRHDFEIVVDPEATVEEDLARRDFTVNAMAKRLEDGTVVDPFRGRDDLERRTLRTVSPRSFAEDPLRIVRGLRFMSQLGFELDDETLAQMREHAASVALVSGERVGGGLSADGMGELSKLLLGPQPGRALRVARDTGVLVALLPEFGEAVGFEQESRYHDLTVDEHTFAVVQAAADAGVPLRVRLAGLFHDLGKPRVAWRGADGRLHFYRKPGFADHNHEEVSAELATSALSRLRYPTELRRRVVAIVRAHMFNVGKGDGLRARRMLSRYGDELTFDLLDHKEADLRGKRAEEAEAPQGELEKLARFREVVQDELGSPHRLADLAVDGRDLIALGFRPGPPIGRTLRELLKEVVEDPTRNRRDVLLRRAEALR